VVRDYFDLVRGAVSGKVMADTEARDFILRRAGSWYDRDVVKAFALELERHNSRELSQLEVRLPVERLRAGMQLARDLVTTDGAMLLSRAQPITETLVQRILALVDRPGVQLVLYVTRASLPGVECFSSAANFLLLRINRPGLTGTEVFQRLQQQKVLVKNVGKMHSLLENCLRVTVSTPQENAAFLSALQSSLMS
jgi:hypothetical protein